MGTVIESASAKLSGIWLSTIVTKHARKFFAEIDIELYKIFEYPGGNFVVFNDEADLLAIKLKYTREELESEIMDWVLAETLRDVRQRGIDFANSL